MYFATFALIAAAFLGGTAPVADGWSLTGANTVTGNSWT